MSKEVLRISTMLADDSYSMEFHRYLTNHSKHGVIALHRLGASIDQIEKFLQWYSKNTYGFGLDAASPEEEVGLEELNESTWRSLLGKKERMFGLKRFFAKQAEEVDGGLDEVLQKYVPELINGSIGSLFHGSIHLGWAIDANHREMILEGVAYLAFAHVDCVPSSVVACGEGRNVMETFRFICETWHKRREEILEWIEETVDPNAGGVLKGSGTQLRISQILARGHALLDIGINYFDGQVNWKELEYVTTVIFLTDPGNFVLLHLITDLHAMKKIAEKLEKEEDKILVAKCFWKSLITTLVTLTTFPTIAQLESVESEYCGMQEDPEEESKKSYWANVGERALNHKDEHNAKLVYVLKKWYGEHGNRPIFRLAAQHFTATPKIR